MVISTSSGATPRLVSNNLADFHAVRQRFQTITDRFAGFQATAPTKPSNRSSIYSPPDLSAAIVELFLSTILRARI